MLDNNKFLHKNIEPKKIISKFKFCETTINKLKKICDIKEEDNNIYIISNIKDYNLFLYYLSKEIVSYPFDKYLGQELEKHFEKAKSKYILENHKKKTFEVNHLELLVKTKLLIYFKNNTTLNIASFYKFNLEYLFKDLDRLVEYEIFTGGELLEDETAYGEDTGLDIFSLEANESKKMINYIKYLKSNIDDEEKLNDIHVYIKNNQIYLVNESLKEVTYKNTIILEEEINRIYDNMIDNDSKTTKDNLFTSVLVGAYEPERIILYASLPKEFSDIFLNDLSFLKKVLSVSTEYYISKELTPEI